MSETKTRAAVSTFTTKLRKHLARQAHRSGGLASCIDPVARAVVLETHLWFLVADLAGEDAANAVHSALHDNFSDEELQTAATTCAALDALAQAHQAVQAVVEGGVSA